MMNIDKVLEAFVTGDYFFVFLALMVIILVVLIISLIKSREEYNDLLDYTKRNYKNEPLEDSKNIIEEVKRLTERQKQIPEEQITLSREI